MPNSYINFLIKIVDLTHINLNKKDETNLPTSLFNSQTIAKKRHVDFALLALSMGYSQNEDIIQLDDGEETIKYFP